ncbi:MAG: hypothetical protein Q7S53_04905 [bacterium]|nr:hypothetical protein [bacterium]
MAIDQAIDYKASPPKGLEKALYRLISWSFVIAAISLVLSLPLIALSKGGEQGAVTSFFFVSFLDQYGIVYPLVLLAISLAGMSFVIWMIRTSRDEGDERVIFAEFLISVIMVIVSCVWLMLKGADSLVTWIASMIPRENFADNLAPYIYGYLIAMSVLIAISSVIWFVVVRIRERKARVNMLKGGFLRKLWQFFVGDLLSIKPIRSNGEICFEAKLYSVCLFFRAWFSLMAPLFALVFVDLGARWVLSWL